MFDQQGQGVTIPHACIVSYPPPIESRATEGTYYVLVPHHLIPLYLGEQNIPPPPPYHGYWLPFGNYKPKPPLLSRAFGTKSQYPLSRENGNTHAAPLGIVGGGGGMTTLCRCYPTLYPAF